MGFCVSFLSIFGVSLIQPGYQGDDPTKRHNLLQHKQIVLANEIALQYLAMAFGMLLLGHLVKTFPVCALVEELRAKFSLLVKLVK